LHINNREQEIYGRLIPLGKQKCKDLSLTFSKKNKPNGVDFTSNVVYKSKSYKSICLPKSQKHKKYHRSVTEIPTDFHSLKIKGFPLATHDLYQTSGFRVLLYREGGGCRLFAGCTKRSKIKLKNAHVIWETKTGIDAFFEPKLLMWKPAAKKWYQVSMLGILYEFDPVTNACKKTSCPDNVMEDKSIIVCGSLVYLWTVTDQPIEPEPWLCPITLEEIPMSHMNQDIKPCDCKMSLFGKNCAEVSNDLMNNRPWYFTGCGHVFSFHKGLTSKHSCPVCRTTGSYQPLFRFREQSTLECALVPCGHVVSHSEAIYFSKDLVLPSGDEWTHQCPFCMEEISSVCKLYY
jgi:hypothetical protein